MRTVIRTLAAAAVSALALSAAAPAAQAEPQSWVFDPSHTHILFFVDHFGMSDIQGEFLGFEGELLVDEENPENSSLTVTIDITSLDTGYEPRDEHFLSGDFFDAEAFPQATFTSTSVEPTSETTATVTGDLTIKGNTAPVTLAVTLNGLMDDHPILEGTQRFAGFTAEGTVLRSDYGVDGFVPAVADEVVLRIETEVNQPVE